MAENRVFVNGSLIDRWVASGRVELDDGTLDVRGTEHRFAAEEAVRVLAEVTGGTDAHGLVGRVRSVVELSALKAELLDRSMVIGDLAYDVDPGFLLAPRGGTGPVATAPLLAALAELAEQPGKGRSDEELLARYLIQKL